MHYSTLENISIEVLRTTFVEAFSEYEIPIHLTTDSLLEMMRTRDLLLDRSVGAFDNGNLVGFILCGYRNTTYAATLYDGGTGVIPEYQGNKIASGMLSWILEDATRIGVDRFLLEVLEHNQAAKKLYLRAGFSDRRFFRCYRMEKRLVQKHSSDLPCSFEPLDREEFEKLDHQKMLSHEPSWQNDVPSVLHNWEQLSAVKVMDNDKVIAYGVIHRAKGDIPQLGLATEYPDSLYGCILEGLSQLTESKTFSVTNVEESSRLQQYLMVQGWQNHINQFEMLYEFR